MNVKLLFGVLLFVVGLVTVGIGIVGVAAPVGPDVAVESDQNAGPLERATGNVAIPIIAGLSLGIGGLLIGLSMGNWKHPRTHLEPGDEVVDPEGYHKMRHV
jgi:hypothetical protein